MKPGRGRMGSRMQRPPDTKNKDDDDDIKICDPNKYMSADDKNKLKMKPACISYCEDKETACGGFDEDGEEIPIEPICKKLKVCYKTGSIWQIPKDVKRYSEMLMGLLKNLDPGAALSKFKPSKTPTDMAALNDKKLKLEQIKNKVDSLISGNEKCKSVLKDLSTAKSFYKDYKQCIENPDPNENDPVLVCFAEIGELKGLIDEYMKLKQETIKMEPGASGTFKRFKALASKYKDKEKAEFKSLTKQTKTAKRCKKASEKRTQKAELERANELLKKQSSA